MSDLLHSLAWYCLETCETNFPKLATDKGKSITDYGSYGLYCSAVTVTSVKSVISDWVSYSIRNIIQG